ncbi:hypothetical protein Tco_0651121, partial [Tanacetum coccineum]
MSSTLLNRYAGSDLIYKGLDVPTRQILDSKGAIPSMKAADAKKAIQDMVDHSQKWHNETSTSCRSTKTFDGLATIQAQLNNLGREIKKNKEKHLKKQITLNLVCHSHKEDNIKQQLQDSTKETMATLRIKSKDKQYVAIRNQGALIKALEIEIEQMSKILQERGSRNLPSSTKINPRDHVKSISTTVDADTTPISHRGSSLLTIVESIHLRFDEIKEMTETSVANDTSGLVPQRQNASDYDNSNPIPQLQNVSPLANTTAPSQQELDLLFGPLYDEFFNTGTSSVNKSSSPTDNSTQQDTLPTTNIHPT